MSNVDKKYVDLEHLLDWAEKSAAASVVLEMNTCYSITGLHDKKVYTHSGTTSSQIVLLLAHA